MNNIFCMHVNNHKNRKSFTDMTSGERKKSEPSYTVVGILQDNAFKMGVSVCSKQDNFSKEVGRKRATEEAQNSPLLEIPDFVIKGNQLGKYFVTKAKRLIKK